MRCAADAGANQAAAEEAIRKAARQGANIVCLPELYRSRYFCQSEDHANFALAEPIPGPSTKALGALAKKLKIAIVGSLFERRSAGVYHHAAVNRVGHEGAKGGGIEFFGASFLCDPYGRMVAEASRDKAEVLVAEVDPSVVETARQHWPFLRDRRIDAYGSITERSLEKR